MTRLAIVHKEKCFSKKCGFICGNVCPMNRAGKECITLDEKGKARIDEMICSGCGICPKKCPFGAINIINLPERLKESPVHRFGENSFELFRLPIPKKGQIVGLLGGNGIGKTTALEILSHKLFPNLNHLDRPATTEEIIKFFKGSELQTYFTNLYGGAAKISYKPQHIDQISRAFEGTVKEMLLQFGRESEIKQVAKSLNFESIMDRKVPQLSGGELQKIAIAAALLKDANFYFFDEPASFLDIKERINAAQVLKEKSKSSDVMAVEHDLIILDYLTDTVHIFFGEKAAYGVVSHPLSSKEGINTYLNGYLRDENIRFRGEPIKFGAGGKKEELDLISYIFWPEINVQLGSFSLKVEASSLARKQVVGIIGANGTGKTTFVKALAGLVKPKEKLDLDLKISYKPQHIVPDARTVRLALLEANKNAFSQRFQLAIIEPLQLDPIMDKPLNELSGGELQRVAIATCLIREADLYLLDEPSTYLDVEQRLMAAQAIQKTAIDREVAVLVVDHDLMFVNHVSDKIMLFSGTPAKNGVGKAICGVQEGMNAFLKELGITCRKDPETGRPRVNKEGSVKDNEQKAKGKYYL